MKTTNNELIAILNCLSKFMSDDHDVRKTLQYIYVEQDSNNINFRAANGHYALQVTWFNQSIEVYQLPAFLDKEEVKASIRAKLNLLFSESIPETTLKDCELFQERLKTLINYENSTKSEAVIFDIRYLSIITTAIANLLKAFKKSAITIQLTGSENAGVFTYQDDNISIRSILMPRRK